jgi:hypothetical protein
VQEAESILKARLTELLETELQDDGYAVKTDFVTRDDEGALTVTLYAECIEQIAGGRDMTDDEIDAANRLRDEILSGKENNGQ